MHKGMNNKKRLSLRPAFFGLSNRIFSVLNVSLLPPFCSQDWGLGGFAVVAGIVFQVAVSFLTSPQVAFCSVLWVVA